MVGAPVSITIRYVVATRGDFRSGEAREMWLEGTKEMLL